MTEIPDDARTPPTRDERHAAFDEATFRKELASWRSVASFGILTVPASLLAELVSRFDAAEARVRELEAENARLRGTVMDLTGRLNAALDRAGRLGAELADVQD